MLVRISVLLFVAAFLGGRAASAQQVTKQTVPGVTNFAKLETTVACGGAVWLSTRGEQAAAASTHATTGR